MEENKYTVVGKVEIGTDEYRDLIEGKFRADNRADSYMRDGWKKDEKISDLQKEVEKLTSENEKLKKILKTSKGSITEESITLFMNELFGDE